jgi:hypothetical protein
LAGYGRHALTIPQPLLRLKLLSIRTFRVAVSGNFVTRLGAGGTPFLLPMLYQIGMGFTPVQAALLILPQPLAAMSLKITVPHILQRFGYRRVLLWNTTLMGSLIASFAMIGPGTRIAQIIAQGFLFGFCSSLQYSSMNTLVYADITDRDASMGSTIAGTMQQMSMSFGVAVASLTAALFIPDRFHSDTPQLIHGIHIAFVVLGSLTILSTWVFKELTADDGAAVARGVATQSL